MNHKGSRGLADLSFQPHPHGVELAGGARAELQPRGPQVALCDE